MLPHDTPALQLLQRVRDEAHRFAIEFHRGRRDKAMTRSILDEPAGRRARRASGCSCSTSARPSASSRPAARSSRRCPACPARSPATFTTTSQDPMNDRYESGHLRTSWSSPASRAPASRRRWPRFEDAGYFCVDNLPPEMIGVAGRPVRPRGQQGRARGRGLRRSRRRLLRRPGRRCSTISSARRVPYRLLFLEAGEPDADQPLQGDAPAPSAAPDGGLGRRRHPPGARAARAAEGARRRASSTPPTSSAARLRRVVADKMLAARGRSAGWRSPS